MTAQDKKFLLRWLPIMVVNFVLLSCAFVKAVQHQHDTEINYLIIMLLFNIFARVYLSKVQKKIYGSS